MAEVPTRYMLDSDSLNHLSRRLETTEQLGSAVDRGAVEIMVTHVQIDELEADGDIDRRCLKVLALLRLRARLESTTLAVWGRSRWNLPRWTGEAAGQSYETHLGNGSNRVRHSRDALIAATAADLGATLVTENSKDRARTLRGQPRLRIIDLEAFIAEVLAGAGAPPPHRPPGQPEGRRTA